MAIYVGSAVLLVQSSYRKQWNFPGGGIRRGETPEAAARRELAEEIGLSVQTLVPAAVVDGMGRNAVQFFELRLAELPALRLDSREIIAAQLTSPEELPRMALTDPVAAYLRAAAAHG